MHLYVLASTTMENSIKNNQKKKARTGARNVIQFFINSYQCKQFQLLLKNPQANRRCEHISKLKVIKKINGQQVFLPISDHFGKNSMNHPKTKYSDCGIHQ